jgi:gluconokinase
MDGKPIIVVMGVSGSGKSTVAKLISDELELPFAEGDDFHPAANVAKMSEGHPLTDADRWPWLDAIAEWIAARDAAGTGGVVTCSALKVSYRKVLTKASPLVWFAALDAPIEVIADRLARRKGHFMPVGLLQSQFDDLEPLADDERGGHVDIIESPETAAAQAIAEVRRA